VLVHLGSIFDRGSTSFHRRCLLRRRHTRRRLRRSRHYPLRRRHSRCRLRCYGHFWTIALLVRRRRKGKYAHQVNQAMVIFHLDGVYLLGLHQRNALCMEKLL
jgi:hypothetical protein